MKKCFGLFLALTLLFGLAVSASAGRFTDEAAIRYPDTVAIMVDLGLINGFSDGSFRPGNNLRRCEAAKLIALVYEEHPSAEAVSFRDVPQNHWAAPYIGYCAKKGIIGGSDGLFRPEEYVTGREFAKMLLVCLGYAGDGYVGGGWSVSVDRDARELGIYDGFPDDPGRILSRDEVCLFLYNAMQCYAVEGVEADGSPRYALDELRNPVTYMERRFGLVKFTGILTGNDMADLTVKGGHLEDGTSKLAGHNVFRVSTPYTMLGRTVELYALRRISGNTVTYTPIGRPTANPTEVAFTANSIDGYLTVLQLSRYQTDGHTVYYYNGDPSDATFLGYIREDCSIMGIDRNGDHVLEAIMAVDFVDGTVSSTAPLQVSSGGKSAEARCLEGAMQPAQGQTVRCLHLGGRYFIP